MNSMNEIAMTNTLSLDLVLQAPRAAVWRCWTEPELLLKWFTPKPWETVKAEVDLRPGGQNLIVMRGPDGNEFPNTGVYLEIDPLRKLVFTDAYTAGWKPSAKPFMTAVISLDDAEEGKTRYSVRVHHWTKEDMEAHEKMGFHEGWAIAARQLEETAQEIS